MAKGRKREGSDAAKRAADKKDLKKGVPPVRKRPRESLIKASRRFFEGVWQELKKVHWPTRREVMIYTGVVLVSVVFVGVILMVADLILSQILTRIIT
jgi:preprotein translocase subunit SecE